MTLRLALPASVALALLLTPVLAASPSPQGHELFQVDRLTFPQGDARFGEDLDREGDTLAVGIPASEGGFAGQEVGQVQIFSNVSGSWVRTQDLFPVHAYNVGHFGEALDLDGDTLVVGAPGESVPGVQGTGYVYIFRRVGGTFTLEQELLSPTLESFEGFGREVSLDGDVLLVKGSTEFVFERMGSTWSLRSTVGPAFSTSMTASFVSGDQILIERSGFCGVCRAAHVYAWNGTQYQQTAAVQSPDPGERFMDAVAAQGNTFVIGAPASNSSQPPAADSYVYERSGTTLNLVAELEDPSAVDFAFGRSVAFDGRWAVVGAPTEGDFGQSGSSLAVFDGDDAWSLTTRINVPESSTFATCLSIEANQLLVGDPGLNEVLVYDLEDRPGAVVCSPIGALCTCLNATADPAQGCVNSTGVGAELVAVGSPSVAADELRLRASNLPPATLALLFAGDALLGSPGARLGDGYRCVSGNLTRFNSTQASGDGVAEWSAATDIWQAGETAYLQVWYRDGGSPCGTFFNLSGTVALTFEP